jgi:hypothetical protein
MPHSTKEKVNIYRRNRWKVVGPAIRSQRKGKYKELKDKVYSLLGGRCSNPACQWLNPDGTRGCEDRRCLNIDHKFGGGRADRVGTLASFRKIIDNMEKYQLLCCNCNWIKRTEKEESYPCV